MATDGFGGERFKSASGRVREERAALAAVEIEHTDAAVVAPGFAGFHIPHGIQRHADDVANTERERAHVHVGRLAVEQVCDHARAAKAIDLLGNLAADRERGVGQRHLGPAAGLLELELALRAGEHDERALGAGDFDRGVEHELEHFLQDAAGPEGPEPFEQYRDLTEVVSGAGRGLAGPADLRLTRQEHQIGAAAPAQPDPVAGLEVALGGGLAIDEGAVP
jgi:hypothetical protein